MVWVFIILVALAVFSGKLEFKALLGYMGAWLIIAIIGAVFWLALIAAGARAVGSP